MKILTFDIEEWYINHNNGGSTENCHEYDHYLDAILSQLNQRGIKATFFCVGEMGRLFPAVVKKIHNEGHEIGCHSNIHTWLNKMSEDECREDTHRAVDSLQQCIGEKVLSYRAPAFSIGEQNKWAFEIFAENGIERDSSVFPAKRDFGGFSHFGQKTPCVVEYNGIRLKEFPICTASILGKEIAYSGGGYFRFFPLGFIKREIERSQYSMCYFHIGDLMPEKGGVPSKKDYENYYKEKGTVKARYIRYIKSNIGKRNAFSKMMELICRTDFVSIRQADITIDWSHVPFVEL